MARGGSDGPLRLGLVGCGGISDRHGRAAADSAEVTIAACCDVRPEVAEAWRERYGCERAFSDYLVMLDEHELDGVLLATWPTQHREQILGCLEAGVQRILCEKALATTAVEALDIWSAASAADALVVEGFMYRHHPALGTIERLLVAGQIGRLERIRAGFSLFDAEELAPDDPALDWRQRVDRGGGVPYDLACYCVDACNHLAGAAPRLAHCLAGTSERYGTVDRLYGLIEYGNGTVGIIESSKRSDFDHELELSGANGRIHLPVAWRIETATEVTVTRARGWGDFEVVPFAVAETDPYRIQLERFAAAARGEAEPAPLLAESVVDAITLDALLRSAAEGRAAAVEVPQEVAAELPERRGA